MKRDLLKDLIQWKEAYDSGKRPTIVERDLLYWKEAYYSGKRPAIVERDLL